MPEGPYILIVDDDADQRFLTRRIVQRAEMQHSIVEVEGGSEAIASLAACYSGTGTEEVRLPSLVFLDLKMPGVDGFAVLRWVRSQMGLHGMKVIVLTSSEEPADVNLCTLLGAQAYLVKHPNAIVMSSVLRRVLGEAPETRPIVTP